VCTEVLEHVQDYAAFLQSIWSVLKVGGILLLTTRSPGFPYHEYPSDHWRFTWSDMAYMFQGQDILTLTKDPTSDPGVGIIVRKVDGTLHECNPTPAPNP
jgi:2-polyprenyl-3-methyl-5-hydroxy-6-metoxy-1,4-benzoquinol methylase